MKKKKIVKHKKIVRKKGASLRKPKKIVVKKQSKILPKKKAFIVKPKDLPIKKIVPPKNKIQPVATSKPFLSENLFKAKIKVIGIGGGGSSIVSEISRSLDKATFVIADTDTRVIGKQKGVKYFLFGQEETRGLGTGLNPELAISAAEKEKEKIATLFNEQDIVIFIASLGGGVGSGATKVFTEMSKHSGAITLGIFTLPFKFEGGQKHKIANKALSELRQSLNVSITIPNERIFKVIDTETPIVQAFSRVNKQLIDSLESLIDLIYNPGLINIDFADIKAILTGRGSEAFLNTIEASGKDRAEKVINQILHNPLYQHSNFVPEKILFNIVGGNNLSMFEVDKISKGIYQKNPKAKIIFGISKNSQLKNSIKATLLMTSADGLSKTEKPVKVVEESKKLNPVNKKKKEILEKDDTKEVAPVSSPIFIDNAVDTTISKIHIGNNRIKTGKKTIRRSALEIKKEQDLQENKKTLQEEEWEIPAFLRIKK